MAKTELNKAVDNFFKKYSGNSITKDAVKKSFNLKDKNEYGNLLHAIVNYYYPIEAKKTTIKILLDLGVNPNHQSAVTGMTFIHLALYGYTDDKENDHPYEENFILEMISLAKAHGFNVNIKDGDNENIAVTAIASEVYRGSIINIISALGSEFKIDDSLKSAFDEYLKESIKVPGWNKRLLREKEAIDKLVKKSNIRIEDVEKEILSSKATLTNLTNNLTFATLTNNYKKISSTIKRLTDLEEKRNVFEVKEEDIKLKIDSIIKTITTILTQELEEIKINPSSKRIETIKPILIEFLLNSLLNMLQEIEEAYGDYQESLRLLAKGIKTINEGKIFLESIKGTELEEELSNIVNEIMESINKAIVDLKDALISDKETFKSLSSFIDSEYEEEIIAYDNLTKQELINKTRSTKKKTASYCSYVWSYLDDKFIDIINNISPLINAGIITEKDIEKYLHKCLSNKKQRTK